MTSAVGDRNWLERYALSGTANPSDSDASRLIAHTQGCLIGGVMAVVLSVLVTLYDRFVFDGSSLDALQWSLLLGLAVAFLPLLLRFGDLVTFAVAAPFSLALVAWITHLLGAESGTHLIVILALSNGLLHMGASSNIKTALSVLVSVVVIVASDLLFPEPSALVRVDQTFLNVMFAAVCVAIIGQMTFTTRSLLRQVETSEAALAAEHARSEALLDNLLPVEIAARLKDEPDKAIADSLPQVAILFADIVGFSPRSAQMQPEAVVDYLNSVFSAFDRLAEKHGLEKVKTIGDAYMAAAGMPIPCSDPVHRVAAMALDMLATARIVSGEIGAPIDIRVGIHTGPAVAGVIGNQRLFYDVWGETVNTASRMESHGAAGRIQVTGVARLELKDDYQFEPRGRIDVKGMGKVDTWWLVGKIARV